jgi:hypothetical protein
MAHVTFRLDDATLARINALRTPRQMSLSAALKELIVLGLEASVGGFASVHEAVGRVSGQLQALEEFLTESAEAQDDELQAVRQIVDVQLDLIAKLGIENVMISRALALTRGRAFLAEAQQLARDYYTNRPSDSPRTEESISATGAPS